VGSGHNVPNFRHDARSLRTLSNSPL